MTNQTNRFVFSVVAFFIGLTATAQTKVVISQVYGGAGCGTTGCSTYKNDFIELFNAGNQSQSLAGWSIQYASATGTAWQITNLSGFILPGQYYLISEGAGSNGINNIPTADATGTIAMSFSTAKVALVSSTTALSGSCPLGLNPPNPSVVDLVGFGSNASCSEGGANAPTPSTTTSIIRGGAGCTDTNNNTNDFSLTSPTPRNSSNSIPPCNAVLPVSFTSFKAQYQPVSGYVTILWSTAQEHNTSYFDVERSTDGNNWTTVSTVPAKGNSTLSSHYETKDAQPQPENNFYRLKQADLDGRFTYSNIVNVSATGRQASFSVYPTPGAGTVFIKAILAQGARIGIQVSDINGRVLLNEQRVYNTAQLLRLELQPFGKGSYFVRLMSGDHRATQKVIVY